MGTILFTVGWCDSEQAYTDLMNQIQSYWKARIPSSVNMLMDRWDKLTPERIQSLLSPTAKLCLVGFSFGGGRTVECCRTLRDRGKMIDGLVLIEPVNHIWYSPKSQPQITMEYTAGHPVTKPVDKPYEAWAGDTWDWVIPWNIRKVACYYRGVIPQEGQSNCTASPWSAPIRGVEHHPTPVGASVVLCPQIQTNKCYGTPAPPKDPHGQWVWEKETIDMAVFMQS